MKYFLLSIFFIINFQGAQAFSSKVLKVKKSRIIVNIDESDSEFLTKGDKFQILDASQSVVGSATLLKWNKAKALLSFKGEVEPGYSLHAEEQSRSLSSVDEEVKQQPVDEKVKQQPVHNPAPPRYNDSYIYHGGRTISQGRYVGGGVASLFLGFGIGHAIQGRYTGYGLNSGWVHTASQVLGLGLLGFSLGASSEAGVASSIVFLSISRLSELIGVWIVPDDVKVAKNDFFLTPVYYQDKNEKGNLSIVAGMRF